MLKKDDFPEEVRVHFSAIQSSSCICLCLIYAGTDRNSFDMDSMDWVFVVSGLTFWRICIYLLTYLLTPWSTVLDKLPGFQLVKKFPAFYGTQRFITAFTCAPSHLCLGLPSGLFPSGICLSSPPYALYAPPISFFLILSPGQCWERSWKKCVYTVIPRLTSDPANEFFG